MLREEVGQLLEVIGRAEDALLGLGRASHYHETERRLPPQAVLLDHVDYGHGERETVKLMRLDVDTVTDG